MSNLQEKLVEMFAVPQVSGLATVTEEGRPWVRNVVTIGNSEMELLVATSDSHRKVKHIENNPQVHLSCGANSLTEMGPYLQVEGIATVDRSQERKSALWNPGLSEYFSGPEDPDYVVLVIQMDRVEYNSPESMGDPEVWIRAK